MEDLEEKLGSLLSSPDTMEKVKNVLQALGTSNAGSQAEEDEEEAPPRPAKRKKERAQARDAEETEVEESEPNMLASLLGAFGGLSEKSGDGFDLSALANLDPKLLSGLFQLLGEYNKKDDARENLILALKPYLRTERQAKVERAAQLMRIARTARSGFSTFLGGAP